MSNENVFLIYFKETGKVIYKDFKQSDIEANDTVVITNEEINSLVEVEIDDSCHSDFEEDYNSKEEFLLSNVERDSYIQYLKGQLDTKDIDEDLAEIIRDEVIDRIKERISQEV